MHASPPSLPRHDSYARDSERDGPLPSVGPVTRFMRLPFSTRPRTSHGSASSLSLSSSFANAPSASSSSRAPAHTTHATFSLPTNTLHIVPCVPETPILSARDFCERDDLPARNQLSHLYPSSPSPTAPTPTPDTVELRRVVSCFCRLGLPPRTEL
ncbi:hypothetical protein C8J57DRAFT_1343610 [Mycena rebaudengoi]|nr:hypothetical protein C8J57DRAFT_1343610 [Mycena rebaudengoi]